MSYATSTDVLLSIISNGVSFLIAAFTLYFTCQVDPLTEQRPQFGILHLGLGIDCFVQLLAIAALILASNEHAATSLLGTNLYDFAGCGGDLILFFIALVNLSVLEVFRILEPRATHRNISRLRWFLFGSFPLLCVWSLLVQTIWAYNGAVFRWLSIMSVIGNALWSILVCVQDNLQAVVLSRRVWHLKRNNKVSPVTRSKFYRVIRILCCAVALDWTSILLYVLNYAIWEETAFHRGVNMFVVGMVGIHLCLSVWAVSFLRSFMASNVRDDRLGLEAFSTTAARD
ncbi:hypothetical protein HDV03_004654 [Kappamyces sp. JEL0829]|nr:hypothetical protein HDV03_004654 [Kappamyces sp. JEL0829]